MHLIFEEDGAFTAATILTDNDSSLQVETATGKRAKPLAEQAWQMVEQMRLA